MMVITLMKQYSRNLKVKPRHKGSHNRVVNKIRKQMGMGRKVKKSQEIKNKD